MRKFMLSLLLPALTLLIAAPARAAWEKVRGPTQFVVIDGETGAVYAQPVSLPAIKGAKVSPPDIYRWEGKPNAWSALGMPAKHYVTAGWKPSSSLFALTEGGGVYRFKGKPHSWEAIGAPAGGLEALYGGPDGLFAATKAGDVYLWQGKPNSWRNINPPMKVRFKTIVVGKSSDPEFKVQVYGLLGADAPARTRGIWQWSGKWYQRGAAAGSIFVSGARLFATNPDSGDLMSLYPTGWKRIGGPEKMFATDARGGIYALSLDNAPADKKGVYRWTGTPNGWDKVGGPAGKIFAGGDGLLFATDVKTSDLYHYKLATGPAVAVPNFAGKLFTEKMKPLQGKRPVLAILWDPQRSQHPAPSKAAIDQVLFGSTNSVRDWFRENSGGRMVMERAGVLGWYKSLKPANHYWETNAKKDPNDKDKDGWLNGHTEKWAEAIFAASKQFNFAAYDTNHDKVLTSDELSILVVIPQKDSFGTMRQPAGREFPKWQPLIVQGMRIPAITEWYTGIPPDLGTPAHELCHILLGAPDLYFTTHWPHAAGVYSIMDGCRPVHLDPFEKLKLGWLRWKATSSSGTHTLGDAATRSEALILFSPQRKGSEYFILENRWRGTSYDRHLPMSGLAIWHVIEDPAVFGKVSPFPTGVAKNEWGRLGIRLIRANGGTPFDDGKALFDRQGLVITDQTSPARLRWADGSPSRFEVKLLTGAGPEIRVEITTR